MKYPKITAILILFSLLLVGCSETKSSDEYIYSGKTILNLDDRSFILGSVPKSIEEETVVKDFLYTISGDFDSKFNLSEYEIINVTYSQKLSSKAIELGPQIGDGTYNRSFIVGRTNKNSPYKIYDFGFL
ncbi:hypothetical protein J2Z35_002410 [Acetoanaerobium pronyense]|uniref:Lipoprotein n=1 Tax=Acetoanaerobium pronyense TaxID=1482736 RepID=A0ABS4KLE6_9FIRM|nr:hypothetical protein [Acetoanaerobium pronyense]MBP2028580.1 hypothetical protein [Acetoanaerobium pronyense]